MKKSETGNRISERVALGLFVIIMVLAGCTKTQHVLVREPASPSPGLEGRWDLVSYGPVGSDKRRENQRLRRVQPVFRRLGIPGGHKGRHPHLADRVDQGGLRRAHHDTGIPLSGRAEPCLHVCGRGEGASSLLRRGAGSPAVFQRGEPLGEEAEKVRG
jgi:hypothetical protein